MRRLHIAILIIVGVALPTLCSAQLYAMRDSVANGYDFWLYLPEGAERLSAATQDVEQAAEERQVAVRRERITPDSLLGVYPTVERIIPTGERNEGLPIVIFLHGRSLCGRDLYRVRKYGTLDALTMGVKIDAVVIAPQNRGDGWWKPERVMQIVEWVKERYRVDATRLYVLGMSLGGYGTLDFAATYPHQTAAAMALCGGSSIENPASLSRVPLWIMHGTADRDVPVSASRRVRDIVEESDTANLMRYDELSGAGHSLLARLFYLRETYDWLFKHSTADFPRTVDRDVEITRARIDKAYSGLHLNSVKLNVVDPDTTAKSTAAATTTTDAVWYTIKSGDTLGHIAARYNTTVKRLCALNNISSKSILRIGQRLRVR